MYISAKAYYREGSLEKEKESAYRKHIAYYREGSLENQV